MFKKIHISCDEATAICDKNQYKEATLLEKLKLNFHFLTCKICWLYTKQNNTLTDIYKGYATGCKSIKHTMPHNEKEALKAKLKEQLN